MTNDPKSSRRDSDVPDAVDLTLEQNIDSANRTTVVDDHRDGAVHASHDEARGRDDTSSTGPKEDDGATGGKRPGSGDKKPGSGDKFDDSKVRGTAQPGGSQDPNGIDHRHDDSSVLPHALPKSAAPETHHGQLHHVDEQGRERPTDDAQHVKPIPTSPARPGRD